MKNSLYFSKFLGIEEKKGITAIFHKLHPCPIYLKTRKWKLFKEKLNGYDNKKLITEFKKQGLIIHSNKEDGEELKKARREFEKKISRMSALFLVLTHDCNLKCKYCFIPRSFKKDEKPMMTPEIAKKGIDLWLQHIGNDPQKENRYYSIIFYGGEPLLNLRTLLATLEYIKKLQRKNKILRNNLQILADTNGTLINKEIAQLFKEYNIKANISLDGPKAYHDHYRIDEQGRGSFKKVTKAIKLLQSEGVGVCVSTNVTPYNLKQISNFPRFFLKYKIKEVGFITLCGQILYSLKPRMRISEYYTQAAKKIIDSFLQTKRERIYEYRIEEKIQAFFDGRFFPIDCAGYGAQLVIQPDGMISNCPASAKYHIKNINECNKNFRIWKNSSVKKWRKRLPLYNSKCLNCKAISICGGGCPWNTEELKGNILKRDIATCIFSKKFFKFLIWNFKDTK